MPVLQMLLQKCRHMNVALLSNVLVYSKLRDTREQMCAKWRGLQSLYCHMIGTETHATEPFSLMKTNVLSTCSN